jgi:uncharacterized iron-regulated protein
MNISLRMPFTLLLLTVLAQASSAQLAPSAYVPERVFDTRRGAFADLEVMIADLSTADVILVGEQHDDPNTHRLEQAILEGFLRRRVRVIVSMEMFERDVQPAVDQYLAGSIPEDEFLKSSRPWPRYASDYRPLVELARGHGWQVVAANVPRRLAADVAKSGKTALDSLSAADRALAARDLRCPQDAYFERFSKAMGGHATGAAKQAPAPGAPARGSDEAPPQVTNAVEPATERYYWSQCVKDETMAESIAAAIERRAEQTGPVVHFTGAFHSDFGAGTAERTRRRLAGRRVVVVSILPVPSLDGLTPSEEDLTRADFLLYTHKSTPNSELRTPNSELRTPNSELRTPNSELLSSKFGVRSFPSAAVPAYPPRYTP